MDVLLFYCSDDMEALNSCRFVIAKQMWYYLRNSCSLKYLNYWIQAYLLDATDIYIAYKNSNGCVSEAIVHKSLSELSNEFVC